MRHLWIALLFVVFLAAGCADHEKENALQSQLSQAETDRQSYKSLLSERDAYIEDVMKEINSIYAGIEAARAKEGRLLAQKAATEGATSGAALDTRKQLLNNITSIGDELKENRKRINGLIARLKASQSEIASLNKLVENLQATLLEREQSITRLQAQIAGLETTINNKTRELAEKDMELEHQRRMLGTGYYVAAPREELEEKGIVTEEGGFLWGLLGSTTVMSSGIDPTTFTAMDKTREQTIRIPGHVAEILPRRNADLFAVSETEDNGTELKILQPEKFWQDKYLVVVLD